MTYAAIEAGGTKFVCSVGDDQGTILDQVSFPTTEPEE
ncbi:ROK family protein, partial [Streptococcus anginosus]